MTWLVLLAGLSIVVALLMFVSPVVPRAPPARLPHWLLSRGLYARSFATMLHPWPDALLSAWLLLRASNCWFAVASLPHLRAYPSGCLVGKG